MDPSPKPGPVTSEEGPSKRTRILHAGALCVAGAAICCMIPATRQNCVPSLSGCLTTPSFMAWKNKRLFFLMTETIGSRGLTPRMRHSALSNSCTSPTQARSEQLPRYSAPIARIGKLLPWQSENPPQVNPEHVFYHLSQSLTDTDYRTTSTKVQT